MFMVIHQQDCYENENSKKVLLEEHAEKKVFGWDCCYLHPKLGLLLSVCADDINMAGKQKILSPMWAALQKHADLEDTTLLRHQVYFACTQREAQAEHRIVMEKRQLFAKTTTTGTDIQIDEQSTESMNTWSSDIKGHAQNCVQRYCGFGKKTVDQLHKVSTSCLDDHQIKPEDMESLGELKRNMFSILFEMLISCSIWTPDLLWTVTDLARSVTNWSCPYEKRLARLRSYVHQTARDRHCCQTGYKAVDRKLGLFQDAGFA